MHVEPEIASARWDSILLARSDEPLGDFLFTLRNSAHPPPEQSLDVIPRLAAAHNLAIGRRNPDLIAELVDGQRSGRAPNVLFNIDLGWQYPDLFTVDERARSIAVFDTLETYHDYARQTFPEHQHALFLYERGLARWWTGDLTAARAAVGDLGSLVKNDAICDVVVWSLMRRLEGLVLYSETAFDEALVALNDGLARVIGHPGSDGLARGYLHRAVRSEILYAQGQVESAIASRLPLIEGGELDPLWSASTYQRLSQWYDELGYTDQAVFHYRRFIDWWKTADESLQPRVEAARDRLRALTEEAGQEPGG